MAARTSRTTLMTNGKARKGHRLTIHEEKHDVTTAVDTASRGPWVREPTITAALCERLKASVPTAALKMLRESRAGVLGVVYGPAPRPRFRRRPTWPRKTTPNVDVELRSAQLVNTIHQSAFDQPRVWVAKAARPRESQQPGADEVRVLKRGS